MRRRRAAVEPSAAFKTGPQAAAAWEAHSWHTREWEAEHRRARAAVSGDAHAARAVAPGAVLATTGLRAVVLAGVCAIAVELTRLVLVASVADPVELLSSRSWEVAGSLTDVTLAATAAATMVATVFVIGWASIAERNVRALSLDTRRWGPSIHRAGVQVGLAAVLTVAWGWAPGAPERSDRVLELGLATVALVVLVAAATTTSRLLVAITARELQQEELLLRIEAASVERPRSRASML